MSEIEIQLELPAIYEQILQYCHFEFTKEGLQNERIDYNPLVITRKLKLVEQALQAVITQGDIAFVPFRDVSKNLLDAKKGRRLSGQDIWEIVKLIKSVKTILHYERLLEFPHDELNDLFSTLVVLNDLEAELERCINPYGEVKEDASSQLRNIQQSLKNAQAQISKVVNDFMASHSGSMVDQIVTERSGRTVLLVKASDKNSFGGIIYGDSASGLASYIEPSALVHANNQKQQLLQKQQEEIDRILTELSQKIQQHADECLSNFETIKLIDGIFAKATYGKHHDCTVAQVSHDETLYLEKARHPLIDKDTVVSNTYRLELPCRMLLITGPNTGGKTVSLKIIGLFVLMSYLGIPIPVVQAKIPFFDQVFADIGDDQSVVSSLSNFSAHIKKQAFFLKNATKNSLILLDEIGSGTDPIEGEALAISILNYLRDIKAMVIATTHYSRLKAYGKRHHDITLASVEFDQEKLLPTYRFIEGLTGSSNAFEVAQRYGLPKGIIQYARFLKQQSKTDEDTLIDRLEKQLQQNHQLQDELEKKITLLEEEKQAVAKEKQKYERLIQSFEDSKDEKMAEILEHSKQQAKDILASMRMQKNQMKYHEVLNIAKQLEVPEEKTVSIDEDFHVGDVVEIKASKQIAKIVELRKKDIKVSLNGREIFVKKNQIRLSNKRIVEKIEPVSFHVQSDVTNVSFECNLIGMTVEEGLIALSKYIDQAILSHRSQFRVVHGNGSGKLRKAVHQALAADPNVEEYAIAMAQEGGTGATVVKLKV